MSKKDRQPLENDELKAVLEALLFVSGDPLPVKRLADVVEQEPEAIRELLDEMAQEYEEDSRRGMALMEVAGGFQFRSSPQLAPYVHRFLERKRMVTLTGPALETLAIVAYRQPLARAEIEAIRGVSVDGVLRSLLDKRLLKVAGVGDGPGKPNLYGTTKAFLEQFGLRSLEDLPPIEDLEGTFSSRAEPIDADAQGMVPEQSSLETDEAEVTDTGDSEDAESDFDDQPDEETQPVAD